MHMKHLYILLLFLFSLPMYGCGGGEGLNGALAVTTEMTATVVKATAVYTNPQTSNLIGVPITFNVLIGNQNQYLGTFNTNNSGSVAVEYTPLPFNDTQTITVSASTGNLSNFSSITMTGRSLTVTPPTTVALTTSLGSGTSVPFAIQPIAGFVAITDPFTNNLSGHTITISTSIVSTNPADTLSPPTVTDTNSNGTAPFPGATGTLIVPAAIEGVETMTITWTITDTVTGLIGTGITTVTLTKIS